MTGQLHRMRLSSQVIAPFAHVRKERECVCAWRAAKGEPTTLTHAAIAHRSGQAGAVEDDKEGAELVQDGGGDGRDFAHRTER